MSGPVACSLAPCGHPDHVRVDFAGFSGTVVLSSSNKRKCFKCWRMIGRRRGYLYGPARTVDVCTKCHKRNYRRSRRPTTERR